MKASFNHKHYRRISNWNQQQLFGQGFFTHPVTTHTTTVNISEPREARQGLPRAINVPGVIIPVMTFRYIQKTFKAFSTSIKLYYCHYFLRFNKTSLWAARVFSINVIWFWNELLVCQSLATLNTPAIFTFIEQRKRFGEIALLMDILKTFWLRAFVCAQIKNVCVNEV